MKNTNKILFVLFTVLFNSLISESIFKQKGFPYELEKPLYSNILLTRLFVVERYNLLDSDYVRLLPCYQVVLEDVNTKKKFYVNALKELMLFPGRKGDIDEGNVCFVNMPLGCYKIHEISIHIPAPEYRGKIQGSSGVSAGVYYSSSSSKPSSASGYEGEIIGTANYKNNLIWISNSGITISDDRLFILKNTRMAKNEFAAKFSIVPSVTFSRYFQVDLIKGVFEKISGNYEVRDFSIINNSNSFGFLTMTNKYIVQKWILKNGSYTFDDIEIGSRWNENDFISYALEKVSGSPWQDIVSNFAFIKRSSEKINK